MKLYIYKTQDMSGVPLMSFTVNKTPNTIKVDGLASNTQYWIKVLDDNDLNVVLTGNTNFSTLNYNNEPIDPNGYQIVLEEDGFYLYRDNQKVESVSELTYTLNNSTTRKPIDRFPIVVSNYNDYITIYSNNGLIAISERNKTLKA